MATCNAGHGCTISCPDGCGAVYAEPDGPCTTWCEGSQAMPDHLRRAETFSIDLHDIRLASLVHLLDGVDEERKALAERGDARVTLSMQQTTLVDLSRELTRRIG